MNRSLRLEEIFIQDMPAWLIRPQEDGPTVLMLHGYGGCRDDMLPLGCRLALEGLNILCPDLPGHGGNPRLLCPEEGPAAAASALELAASLSKGKPGQVGFSLGARLALHLHDRAAATVAVSPPGEADFEGGNRELLTNLPCRRVRERRPYEGLRLILAELGPELPTGPDIKYIHAAADLSSVRRACRDVDPQVVPRTDHRDVLRAPETLQAVTEWLPARLRSEL